MQVTPPTSNSMGRTGRASVFFEFERKLLGLMGLVRQCLLRSAFDHLKDNCRDISAIETRSNGSKEANGSSIAKLSHLLEGLSYKFNSDELTAVSAACADALTQMARSQGLPSRKRVAGDEGHQVRVLLETNAQLTAHILCLENQLTFLRDSRRRGEQRTSEEVDRLRRALGDLQALSKAQANDKAALHSALLEKERSLESALVHLATSSEELRRLSMYGSRRDKPSNASPADEVDRYAAQQFSKLTAQITALRAELHAERTLRVQQGMQYAEDSARAAAKIHKLQRHVGIMEEQLRYGTSEEVHRVEVVSNPLPGPVRSIRHPAVWGLDPQNSRPSSATQMSAAAGAGPRFPIPHTPARVPDVQTARSGSRSRSVSPVKERVVYSAATSPLRVPPTAADALGQIPRSPDADPRFPNSQISTPSTPEAVDLMQLAQDTPSSEEVLRGRAQELQEEMAAVKAQYKEEIAQHVMSILQQKNLSHAIAIENEYLNHKISELQAQAAATQSGLVPRDNLTELEGKLIKAQEEIDELSRMRDMENLRWEQQLLARDLTIQSLQASISSAQSPARPPAPPPAAAAVGDAQYAILLSKLEATQAALEDIRHQQLHARVEQQLLEEQQQQQRAHEQEQQEVHTPSPSICTSSVEAAAADPELAYVSGLRDRLDSLQRVLTTNEDMRDLPTMPPPSADRFRDRDHRDSSYHQHHPQHQRMHELEDYSHSHLPPLSGTMSSLQDQLTRSEARSRALYYQLQATPVNLSVCAAEKRVLEERLLAAQQMYEANLAAVREHAVRQIQESQAFLQIEQAEKAKLSAKLADQAHTIHQLTHHLKILQAGQSTAAKDTVRSTFPPELTSSLRTPYEELDAQWDPAQLMRSSLQSFPYR